MIFCHVSQRQTSTHFWSALSSLQDNSLSPGRPQRIGTLQVDAFAQHYSLVRSLYILVFVKTKIMSLSQKINPAKISFPCEETRNTQEASHETDCTHTITMTICSGMLENLWVLICLHFSTKGHGLEPGSTQLLCKSQHEETGVKPQHLSRKQLPCPGSDEICFHRTELSTLFSVIMVEALVLDAATYNRSVRIS